MRRKIIIISVVLLLLALPLTAWHLFLAHAIDGELAGIRAAGLPANGYELDRWYPAVPDNQNAALVLTNVFASRTNYPDIRSNLIFDFKIPEHRKPLSPEQFQLIQGYVAMNAARISPVSAALKMAGCRYPVNFTNLMKTTLPHLAWLKEVTLLCQYAALVQMQSGEKKSASTNIVTMLALARTLDNEPCAISQLVRVGLVHLAFVTLERRVNVDPLDNSELNDLQGAFAQTSSTNVAFRALVGERAMTIPYFRMSKKEALPFRSSSSTVDSRKESPLPCDGPKILKLIGYYDLDFGSYLIAMRKGIPLAALPPPDNLKADNYFAYAGSASAQRRRLISGLALKSYAGIATRENAGIAYQQLALIALAVEHFRNQTGHLPTTLGELTPQFLSAIPDDPFDGLPLRYKKNEKGYVVYSVASDQQDNGGLEECDKKSSPDGKSYDITLTVER